ncbi:hypothetical protein QL285_043073 [Trifolium repens]|nr:hypothetical protein QL285_043073 [Trifolium repens]
MLAKCYVAIFLALISSLCYASNDVKLQENQTMNNKKLTIDYDPTMSVKIFVALPLKSELLYFDCDEILWGKFVMKPGETRQRPAPTDGTSCIVTWGRLKSMFFLTNGYFWVIKIDGFFRTFDHIHYTKEAQWSNITSI